MNYIGIDLGKDGGMVVLNDDGKIVSKHKPTLIRSTKAKDEYDIPGILGILQGIRGPKFAVVEKAHPMPMRMGGVSANFQRGLSYGIYQTALASLGIPYDVYAPISWQRIMLFGINSDDTKQAALIAAKRLWPKEDWRKSDRAKKADQGFVDAALIGEFGRRKRSGK